MSTVIEQLEREWCRLAVDRRAARRLRAVCDAADRAADLGQLELYVRRAAPADADRILVAGSIGKCVGTRIRGLL
jgi:hypothetical protein